jgi:3'(2'), 5'-bisphosphate nucleotidase
MIARSCRERPGHDFVKVVDAGKLRFLAHVALAVRLQQRQQVGDAKAGCGREDRFGVIDQQGARDEQRRWTRYWLVDPLDGTREFINRTGQFTVNIALVECQRPVLGVLFVPLEQTGFVGIPGAGAARYTPAAGSRWRSSAIRCRALASGQPLALLASHRHRSARLKALLAWLDTHWAGYERFDSSSALKFTDLAQGMGDFYPRFSTCCEWDTAAGQALVEAAGGAVLGMDGQPLRYNTRQSLYSPHFYAVADPDHALWADLIAAQLG